MGRSVLLSPEVLRIPFALFVGKGLLHRAGIIGVNLAVNRETRTPLEDLQLGVRQFTSLADPLTVAHSSSPVAPGVHYIVLNLSSPNTPGMRALQECTQLEALLIKVSPIFTPNSPSPSSSNT